MTKRGYKIYKISNTVNDKVYIGQTITPLAERFNTHVRYSDCELGRAIKELGADKFKIELLDSSATSSHELYLLEHKYIELHDSITTGYNVRPASISNADPNYVRKKVIGTILPTELVKRIRAYSKESMIPISKIIEKAIEQYLKSIEK